MLGLVMFCIKITVKVCVEQGCVHSTCLQHSCVPKECACIKKV